MISGIKNKLRGVLGKAKLSEFTALHDRYKHLPRFQPATIHFRDYSIETPDAPSVIWQIKEIFIDKNLDFQTKEAVPVILDCGANVGLSVIGFRQAFPEAKITAYEADHTVAGYLEKNLARHAIHNVNVVKKAVWTDNKGVSFGSEGADGGSVYFPSNQTPIPSIRLRDEIEKEEYITMLKMDIEGAETDVLEDCADQLQKVEYLFVEYHSWKSRPQELSTLLGILEKKEFRYYISSIGHTASFLANHDNQAGMDVQLNIYAVNQEFKK